jgi:hypothetical protein
VLRELRAAQRLLFLPSGSCFWPERSGLPWVTPPRPWASFLASVFSEETVPSNLSASFFRNFKGIMVKNKIRANRRRGARMFNKYEE